MAALKSEHLDHLGVDICCLNFLRINLISLVLYLLNNFGLYVKYFEYYLDSRSC